MIKEELATTIDSALSTLILKGDISKLSDTEKVLYYRQICERLGLDPMTKPFDYLVLQGKQTLYLNKGGAEQLSKIHNVSLSVTDTKQQGDIYIVTARAHGYAPSRWNDSTGAVNIKGLYGDALCNAYMKAETKAKRRATIGLLGLAMLDETEIETIPNAQKIEVKDVDTQTGEVSLSHQEADKMIAEEALQTDEPDWNDLVIVGKENRWPIGYINQWVKDRKLAGDKLEDIYSRGLAKFGQVNTKAEV